MRGNTAVAMRPVKEPAYFRVPFTVKKGDESNDRFDKITDTIARRAFEIFEKNGQSPGHDLEHWFQAEAELLHPLYTEITEKENQLIVRVEVPGFDARDLDVRIEVTKLTITGEREAHEKRKKAGKTIFTECRADQIFRVMELPFAVDPAKAEAELKDGILEIRLPKAPDGKKVLIEPKAG